MEKNKQRTRIEHQREINSELRQGKQSPIVLRGLPKLSAVNPKASARWLVVAGRTIGDGDRIEEILTRNLRRRYIYFVLITSLIHHKQKYRPFRHLHNRNFPLCYLLQGAVTTSFQRECDLVGRTGERTGERVT